MKKLIKFGLVLAAATGLAGSVAKADSISVTIQETGGPLQTLVSGGSAAVNFVGTTTDFGVTGGVQDNLFLGNPDLVFSQALSVTSSATGGQLTIIVTDSGLTTFPGATGISSSFRLDALVGSIPNATVQEFTLFDGSPTGAGATFDQTGAVILGNSGPTDTPASLSGTFSIGEEYIITTDGAGTFNAGINTAAVPGPIVGAGLPGLMAACGGLIALARRRRQKRA